MRLAIQLIKIDHELCSIVSGPWRPDERSRDWLHGAVSVAILPDQTCFNGILSSDVDNGDRAREKATNFIDR